MTTRRTFFLLVLLLFLSRAPLAAEEERYYTYLGAVFGAGINKIHYNGWFDDQYGSQSISGSYYSGGFIFQVYVKQFIGEFTVQYDMNSNSDTKNPDTSVSHPLYTFVAKYTYPLGADFFAAGGLGLYMETPPATAKYDGGGGPAVTLGMLYEINIDWKIVFDFNLRYGQFGIGEDSTKLCYGITIGVVRNVGRI
jgi:hypothetical protein